MTRTHPFPADDRAGPRAVAPASVTPRDEEPGGPERVPDRPRPTGQDPPPAREADGPLPDRLALAVVQVEDATALTDRLVAGGFGATRIDAAGGFLRRENAVVLVALRADRLPGYLESVRATCRRRMVVWFPPLSEEAAGAWLEPIDVEVGGAVVFVLPIERVAFLNPVPAVFRVPAGVARAGGGA